eukprot:15364522-Ditylum_brightwellii.AAC.2
MKPTKIGNQSSSGGQGKGKGKSLSEGDKDKNKKDCRNGTSNIREKPSLDDQYDRMHYPSLHNYDEWLKKVERNKETRKQKHEKKKETPGSSGDKTKLVLNDSLKAVLCTNCGLSDEQHIFTGADHQKGSA